MNAPSPSPPASAPPGWYADPWSPGGLRWWDGTGWTAHAAAAWAQAARSNRGDGHGALVAIGAGWLVLVGGLIAALVVVASDGPVDKSTVVDPWSPQEQEVVSVVDEFQDAWRDGDGKRMCSEVFTLELADAHDDAQFGSCEEEWSKRRDVDIEVTYVDVDGRRATASGSDYERDWTFEFKRVDGDWRMCNLDPPAWDPPPC